MQNADFHLADAGQFLKRLDRIRTEHSNGGLLIRNYGDIGPAARKTRWQI